MPVETPSITRPRQDLLGAYSEFDPTSRGFIGELVLPPLPVAKRFGAYGIVPREAYLARINTKRAPKSSTSESSWTPESGSFALVEYAHKENVDEVERENYEDWFDAEEIAAQRVAGVIETDYEIDVATAVFNDTTFAADGVTGATITTPWDNASGVPLTDIQTAKQAIEDNWGAVANTLIITSYNYRLFGLNPQVRNSITDNFGREIPAELPIDTIRSLTGLQNIFIARGVYNGAKPGAAPSISKIWNEDRAMVCRIETGRDIKAPQLGRSLTLANQQGVQIDTWDIPDPKGMYVRARKHCQAKMMDTPIGYLLRNTKT